MLRLYELQRSGFPLLQSVTLVTVMDDPYRHRIPVGLVTEITYFLVECDGSLWFNFKRKERMKKMSKVKIFSVVLIARVAAAFATRKRPEKSEVNNTLITLDAEPVDASNKALDFSAFKGKVVF